MPVAGPSDITPTLHISDALNSLPSCCSVFAHIVSLFRRGAPVKQIVAAASLGTVRSASLSLFCARHPTLRRHLRSRSEEDRLFRGLIDGQTLRNILAPNVLPAYVNSLSKKQLPLHKNSWSLKSTLACGQTFKRYAHCVLWAILQLNQKIVHTVLCPISYGQTVKPCRQRHFLMAPHCSSLPVCLRLQLQM